MKIAILIYAVAKKTSKNAVIITKKKVAAKSAAFAGKVKKVNKLLAKTRWLDLKEKKSPKTPFLQRRANLKLNYKRGPVRIPARCSHEKAKKFNYPLFAFLPRTP